MRAATRFVLAAAVVPVVSLTVAWVDAAEAQTSAPGTTGGSGSTHHLEALGVAGAVLVVIGLVVAIAPRLRPVDARTRGAVAPWPSREAAREPEPLDDPWLGRTAPAAPTAAAYVDPHDVAAVHVALERSGIVAQELAEAADVFAAVVRGATLLVVDAGRPGAIDLLRSVRRRIDDGWSDCAVVAYVAPWGPAEDLDLGALVDSLARHPITAADLDLAVRVARSQADDRRGITAVVRSPLAGPVPQAF